MNLKNKNIQNLIDSYFEGTTSLHEEKFLRDYFRQEMIDAEFESYRPMFQYFDEERKLLETKEEKTGFEEKSIRQNTFVQENSKGQWIRTFAITAAACTFLFISINHFIIPKKNISSTTVAYIDGKKHTDISSIRSEMLDVLGNMEEDNEEIFSTQIELLDNLFE